MAAFRIDAGTDIACVGIWDAGLLPVERSIEAAHPPAIVLELHRAEGPLPGGSVELDDVPEP